MTTIKHDFNTLVISDLHLGEDLSPSANAATKHHVDLVERQLCSFFHHYAWRRENGLPWRVVINGDMVDFMAITILPSDPAITALMADRSLEDNEFGLHRTPNSAVAKLHLVAERHATLFRAMARFISRGNRIEIVSGNHDIEFHWQDVQIEFRHAVSEAWSTMAESERSGAASAKAIEGGIGFHPWFFYEPGVVWIEHGHQYDENCSFDHLLNPLHPHRDEIVTNVDTAGTRYVTNYVEEVDPHSQDDWNAAGYVRFGFSLGLRGLLKTTRAYYNFARALVEVRKAVMGPRNRSIRSGGHAAAIAELSETWGLSKETLRSLDGLHRAPVVSSIPRVMRVLMIDKFMLSIAAIVTAVLCLLFAAAPWNVPLALGAIGLARGLMWLTGRGRNIDPGAPLTVVPERILSRIDAQAVIFGHTHEPQIIHLNGGGRYLNTGTWIPSHKPGLARAFTHVVVRKTAGEPAVEMCQWRDGASQPFNPAAHGESVVAADLAHQPSGSLVRTRS